jgi:vacuolar protein sorting-associated protein 54
MLRDAELFKSRLSKLDGAADIGVHIVNIVKDKTVAEPTTSAENKRAITDTPSQKPQENGDSA